MKLFKLVFLIFLANTLVSRAGVEEVSILKVYAFEVVGKKKVTAFKNIKREMTPYMSKMELVQFFDNVDSYSYVDLVFTNNIKLIVNDEYLSQYLFKKGNECKLKRGADKIGISCDVIIRSMKPGGYNVQGRVRYLSIAERRIFEGYSEIDAGEPIRLMGGEISNGFLLPPKKIARLVFQSVDSKDRNSRITGLVFAVERDVSFEDEGAVTYNYRKKRGHESK